MKRMVLAVLAALLLGGGSAASAAVLDRVKERGTLVVGVKADHEPSGFRDPSGAVVGIELSGGRQQRAAIESEMVKEMLVTVRERVEGMARVPVTHRMGFAREIADRVCFTDRGVLVEHGSPDEFFAAPKDERTRAFLRWIV